MCKRFLLNTADHIHSEAELAPLNKHLDDLEAYDRSTKLLRAPEISPKPTNRANTGGEPSLISLQSRPQDTAELGAALLETKDNTLSGAAECTPITNGGSAEPPRGLPPRRSLRAKAQSTSPVDIRTAIDTAEIPASAKSSSLRHRQQIKAQTTPPSERPFARLTRNSAKPVPTIENERRSSRFPSLQRNYTETSRTDEDMGDEKEPTYDKQFVDAHPEDKFYHTGNGWYKRGERPKVRKHAKHRESEGHAIVRHRDGSYEFNGKQTIHVSMLHAYPGVEFHHCGNGWYKPGGDPTGQRTSRIGGDLREEPAFSDEGGTEAEESEATQEDDSENLTRPQNALPRDLKYTRAASGSAGRNVRKGSATTLNSYPVSPQVESNQDQTVYTKAWVLSHPDEEFHHRGNGSYMRGPATDHWASARRRRSTAASATPQEDGGKLYSKEYVDAHPDEVFHHRGQGRYMRGPRTKPFTSEGVVDESDEDLDGLVDTDYVDNHPGQTFHHRGQGRWARGMPPENSSHKTGIRGPGARGLPDVGSLPEHRRYTDPPPALTALVFRTEGPEKYPELQWHYRGGGKWSRATKQEAEDIKNGITRRPTKGKSKSKDVTGGRDTLEDEPLAVNGSSRRKNNCDVISLPQEIGNSRYSSIDRPPMKRRRTDQGDSHENQDDNDIPSNLQPEVPAPRPRMLEPEEDILTEEDLPELYADGVSTPDSEIFLDLDHATRVDNHSNNNDTPIPPFRPLTSTSKFLTALTKHDPATRSLANLQRLALNTQTALRHLQTEYALLDQITAPHARIPRKPLKTFPVAVEPEIFEDRKEADLYDYTFDPRRIGHQDPVAQKVSRDVDGQEIRLRRHRAHLNGTLPGWSFGDDESVLGAKRTVKPVSRFDGIVDQPRKRARDGGGGGGETSRFASATPGDVGGATTPLGGPVRGVSLTRGEASGRGAAAESEGDGVQRVGAAGGRNVPRRIQQLRGQRVGGAARKEKEKEVVVSRESSPAGKTGSKTLLPRNNATVKRVSRGRIGTGGGWAAVRGVVDGGGSDQGSDGWEEL